MEITGNGGENGGTKNKKTYQKSKKKLTIGDLKKELLKNPEYGGQSNQQNKRKKSRRSRQRVENPKQRYMYASQRRTSQIEEGEDDENSQNNFWNKFENVSDENCLSLRRNIVSQVLLIPRHMLSIARRVDMIRTIFIDTPHDSIQRTFTKVKGTRCQEKKPSSGVLTLFFH